MNMQRLREHAKHIENQFWASSAVALALARDDVKKTKKGLCTLIIADQMKAHGGYAMLLIKLNDHGSPNVEYGLLDKLRQVYYQALVHGTKDTYIQDAYSLLDTAVSSRNDTLRAASDTSSAVPAYHA